MTGIILFQPALTKLIVTTGQDSDLLFSSDLACQLLFNFWLTFQVSYPLIKPRASIHANATVLHSRSLASVRARTYALGLRESTRCVRDFCERVRVAHTQLAIICERACNADSRTFETRYSISILSFITYRLSSYR